MTVDTELLVPMKEANQNFSRVVRIVDEKGLEVILKNNKPKYVVVDFDEYDEIQNARKNLIQKTADSIIKENMEEFKELAK